MISTAGSETWNTVRLIREFDTSRGCSVSGMRSPHGMSSGLNQRADDTWRTIGAEGPFTGYGVLTSFSIGACRGCCLIASRSCHPSRHGG